MAKANEVNNMANRYDRFRRGVRSTSGFAVGAAIWALAVAPASAACVPGGPAIASGSSVTCTGADVTGVGNGSQSNVTVNVQPGASITVGAGATAAINLLSQNTIANAGTITAVNIGIYSLGLNNTVVNSGTINAFTDIYVGTGSVTNASTGVLNVGVGGNGIESVVGGSSLSPIVNNGTIVGSNGTAGTMLSGGFGIHTENDAAVTNNGKISMGVAGIGVWIAGYSGVYINNGTITGGDGGSAGIFLSPDGQQNNVTLNSIVNNGVIRAGANSYSLYEALLGANPFAGNNSVTNKGVLDGKIYLPEDGLTNSGVITITNAGTPFYDSVNFVQNYYLDRFIQTSTGTLALRVTNAGASDGLTAGGAQLGGTLGAVVQPGLYAATTKYAGVVSASSPITTQFANVQAFAAGTTTPLAFFTASAIYNTESVDLILNRIGFGAVAGETFNQQQVGNALNAAYSTGLTGNAATFYSNLLQSTSIGVLDQLSGEGTSAAQSAAFFANDLFNNVMGNHALGWRLGDNAGFITGSGAPLGYAGGTSPTNAFAAFTKAPPQGFVPGWRAWGAGFGGGQSIGADPSVGAASISSSAAGGAVGLDHQLDTDLLLGAGVGGSRSSFSVPDRATTGFADAFQAGAYVLRQWGTAYLMGLGSYAHFDNNTSRTIAGIGPTETATGAFGSDLFGGRLEIGNTFRNLGINTTPFAAVQVSSLRQAGYTESSTTLAGAPGVLGLTYQPVTTNSLPTFLGVQFDTAMILPNGMAWSPFARVSWVHEFDPSRNITASLSSLTASTFTVDGARAASDSAKLDLGSQLALTRNVSLIASFNGEFAGREQIYSGTGALRVSW